MIGYDDSITASPIYDNASTLFPNLSESGMQTVLANPKEIMQRIKLYPKAALTKNEKKVGYYDMMSSGIYSELTDAVVRTVPRIRESMPAVRNFIDGCSFLSDIRKDFYNIMLAERMHFILEPAYKRCSIQKFDLSAQKRIEDGIEFSGEDFENYWKQYGPTTYEQEIVDIRNSITKDVSEKNTTSINWPK